MHSLPMSACLSLACQLPIPRLMDGSHMLQHGGYEVQLEGVLLLQGLAHQSCDFVCLRQTKDD